MKKSFFLILLSIVIINGAMAQHRRPTPERKFLYMTSLGYATGLGSIELENKTVINKNFDVSVNQFLGYQFNPYLNMGLGLGFDFWHYTAFIPVSLNFNVNFIDRRISPIFYANVGYSFKWYLSSTPEKMDRVVHGTKTGPMAEAGLGIKIQITDKVGVMIAACYKNQYSDIRYTILQPNEQDFSAYSTNSRKDVLYHFAGVKVGIIY